MPQIVMATACRALVGFGRSLDGRTWPTSLRVRSVRRPWLRWLPAASAACHASHSRRRRPLRRAALTCSRSTVRPRSLTKCI